MLDLRIIADGQPLPLFDLPAVLGRAQAAKEVGDQIEALMAFLDDLGGDPDLEEGSDLEQDNSDHESGSWAEDTLKYGTNATYGDDEREDDLSDVRRQHARRIQLTRCTKVRMGSGKHVWSVYRLPGDGPYLRGMESL